MRALQFLALSGLMLASNIALAAELDRDDVPDRCWDVCSPVVGIAQQCDNTHRDDDRAEMNCICNSNRAPTLVPLCEACISQFRNDTRNGTHHDDDDDDDHDHDDHRRPHDNDAYDILTSCSFSTTTYNAAAATSILSTATGSITPTATNNASGSTGSGGNTGNSQPENTNNGSNAQPNNNAAAGSTVSKAASVAAVVGLIGLAWL
ncbi:hypothetical protein KXW98_008197 [Aspergillus fumigatus]|uniref:GPI anchored protein, putative n=3 Tax=Aspergillus fumigatus TaxID=746128 RepID=Q4WE65_ASPFU|nr:GPI anchored protein, putative [Aspergillus fumigatus Af293]EDP51043.1 GPI anchored protein, putative [Aspergillus fumigatus A1163]KAF4251953.1 hypothetical protein CNMCM8057_006810 [Aspergillus fumigatus]KMK58958.1 GPI anchored protein [Aspergillus fumigatus Z5]EAL86112.1 GPI anchored protein, putative [Aspergillus fumigatus Af293]KAF4282334.1 hypothetical protein CNMCM8689_008477 [Aspergillus fumigatus]